MSRHDAAAYPFDPEHGHLGACVPCWLEPVQLMALGRALEPTATCGAEALRATCRQHQPQMNLPATAEPPKEASRASCGGLIPERPEAARTRNSGEATPRTPSDNSELLDRGDWREALDRAYRARFALEDCSLFLDDRGWSLTAAQVRTFAAALDRRLPQIFTSLGEELRLADLVSDDEARPEGD